MAYLSAAVLRVMCHLGLLAHFKVTPKILLRPQLQSDLMRRSYHGYLHGA
jgi:hypothetical protein